jgi:hypothetical protein
MHIPWDELGQVLMVGLLAGTGVVAVFAFGVTSLATGVRSAAYLCFAVCALAVGYGLYTLLPL